MELDYSLFPILNKCHLIIPTLDETLKKIDEDIYDRLQAAIYMAGSIESSADKYIISKVAKKKAYFRAALTEFISLEDFIEQKYPTLPKSKYKFYKSTNPYYHIIKLLRNYNIHLSESLLKGEKINVALMNEPSKVFDLTVSIIDNLSIFELKKLISAKDYSDYDLEKMLLLFDKEQRKFGVSELLLEGIIRYAEHLKQLLIYL